MKDPRFPPVPPDAVTYDLLVLTAANRAQARGYEAELASREKSGRLEGVRAWRVMPDPGDRRVGSGGSTVHVLAALARECSAGGRDRREALASRRVLILHSGGDSRRLPAYAANGKIFLPLPIEDERGDGRALFDLILADMRSISLGAPGGRVVVATGDVYLGLARHRPDLSGGDVVGVAFPDTPARGSRHGVYVVDSDGRVTDFLQKPSPEAARKRRAIDRRGRVLVDTGVLAFSVRAVSALLRGFGVSAAGKSVRGGLLASVSAGLGAAVDLYDQVLSALRPGVTPEAYAAGVARGAEGAAMRHFATLRRAVAPLSFRCRTVPGSDFLHIGTTRELLDILPRIESRSSRRAGCVAINAPAGFRARGAAVVECCATTAHMRLAGRNVVVGVPVDGELSLPKGIGIVGVPIGARDWAFVLFGDGDDFKSTPVGGGTFLNLPLRRLNGHEDEIWPGVEPNQRSLWNARLWICGVGRRALGDSLRWLASAGPARALRGGDRTSIAELVGRVNHERLIEFRADCERRANAERTVERLIDCPWLASTRAAADVSDASQAHAALRELAGAVGRSSSALEGARLARAAYRVGERFARGVRGSGWSVNELAHRPFELVASAVAMDAAWPMRPPRAGILADQVVWVTCPARIDLSGGWTDTPPVCNEMGGLVVNAAVMTNGQYPVQVICRLSERPGIHLTSVDLGRRVTFESARAIHDHGDPSDWSALPKAALLLSGLAPRDRDADLGRWLRAIVGVDLTVFSALPKGSGMGTSSILGAAVLAALARTVGEELSTRELIRRTSVLEQFMSTGGGWQDQAGGITPGVKLLSTDAGAEQVPRVEHFEGGGCLGTREASDRCLLYYTGVRRLAKNILQNVVGRYLDRDPEMRPILAGLKEGAIDMRRALREGTLSDVGRGLRRYWELKKAIDPGATTPAIEAMLARVERHTDGFGLAGAGAGGFVFMIAKDTANAARIRRMLTSSPLSPTARFYTWALDTKGLHVSVL